MTPRAIKNTHKVEVIFWIIYNLMKLSVLNKYYIAFFNREDFIINFHHSRSSNKVINLFLNKRGNHASFKDNLDNLAKYFADQLPELADFV